MKRFIEDYKETKYISEEEAVDDGDADAGEAMKLTVATTKKEKRQRLRR